MFYVCLPAPHTHTGFVLYVFVLDGTLETRFHSVAQTGLSFPAILLQPPQHLSAGGSQACAAILAAFDHSDTYLLDRTLTKKILDRSLKTFHLYLGFSDFHMISFNPNI